MPPVKEEMVGKDYWRSLDELADTPEFRTFVEQEFPGLTEELNAPATRRSFFKVMAASLALAGMTSCRWPRELILPYANRPEGRLPGVPVQFATCWDLAGAARGLLITSYDGRPVKVEGNPLHPDSLGAADLLAQALVLELYDPDRSRTPVLRQGGRELGQDWDAFVAQVGVVFDEARRRGGAGLAVLAEDSSSVTRLALQRRLEQVLPGVRWFQYEAVSRDVERAAARLAFGAPFRPHLRLEQASVVVSLDADFLIDHPAALRHARHYSATRRGDGGRMSRLYAVESVLSLTGAQADHRLALKPEGVGQFALALAGHLSSLGVPGLEGAAGSTSGPEDDPRVDRLAGQAARDLVAAAGQGVIVAGDRQPAAVHVLVHALNAALGHHGRTITFSADPAGDRPDHMESIAAFAAAAEAGEFRTVLVLGGNPVYDAPADLDLGQRLGSVAVTIRLGLFDDETSRRCTWQVPRAHTLEAWGDGRGWDGTLGIAQPLIAPLYGGISDLELLALLLGDPAPRGHDLVRTHVVQFLSGEFESAWRRALHDGVVAGSALAPATPQVRPEALTEAVSELAGQREHSAGLQAVFQRDAAVHDGRFAGNPWLQELPDPLTRITWDNAALLAPATAAELGLNRGDLVRVAAAERGVDIPVFVLPGHPEGVVGLPLGYGRKAAGRVGTDVGVDCYTLRTTSSFHHGGVTAAPLGRRVTLACTQDHHAIDTVGRKGIEKRLGVLVREATLEEYRSDPAVIQNRGYEPESSSLFASPPLSGEHQWAMSIDMSACIGCNACVVACQAENNVPVVGREQVALGREMQWIRIDRYFSGSPDNPQILFQPMTCMHCEKAPCEQVCPVAATVHSEEGLNQMVYNRCVGTRYCSNNCPYKVRRFNFFNYFKQVPAVTRMAFNPEVTVRSRGVMEKCTFCVQRIETAKIIARNQRRPLADGEIVPACAQTCPTQAIVFGDLKDENSRVARLHGHQRAYAVLGELNIKPRILYQGKLRNPAAEQEEVS